MLVKRFPPGVRGGGDSTISGFVREAATQVQ